MVTCLVHGAAVPFWDRELVKVIQDVTPGLAGAAPDLTIEVSTGEARVFRTIIANGRQEFDALLDRLAEPGFKMMVDDNGAAVSMTELAAAALKSN